MQKYAFGRYQPHADGPTPVVFLLYCTTIDTHWEVMTESPNEATDEESDPGTLDKGNVDSGLEAAAAQDEDAWNRVVCRQCSTGIDTGM